MRRILNQYTPQARLFTIIYPPKIFSQDRFAAPKLKLSLTRTFDRFTDGFSCLLGIPYWPQNLLRLSPSQEKKIRFIKKILKSHPLHFFIFFFFMYSCLYLMSPLFLYIYFRVYYSVHCQIFLTMNI